MQILVALDDCIRNVSILKKELPEIIETELEEYKDFIIPHFKAEDKINKWYDEGHDIHILSEKNMNNKNWLKNHYIPYNSIIEYNNNFIPDIWIDSNIERCNNICSKVKTVFFINDYLNINIDNYKNNNIIFTKWNEIELYD